ncbi:unnamed protein product, partial [Didymodactylos carnosus]
KLYRNREPFSNDENCSLDPNHTHFLLLDDLYGSDIQNWKDQHPEKINCRTDLISTIRAEIEQESRKIIIGQQ